MKDKQKKYIPTTEELKKYGRGYKAYRKKFYEEKKIGNVKNGHRLLNISEYVQARKEGDTNKVIIRAHTIVDAKGKKRIMEDYKKLRIEKGQRVSVGVTYRNFATGETRDETLDLGNHRTLSGLLHDKKPLHYIITQRIANGEDKEEVLEDYGY